MTAEDADISQGDDEGGNPILVFTERSDTNLGDAIIAGFDGWDNFWVEGVVTEVVEAPAQLVNAMETSTDDWEKRARPTRSDRG